MRTWLLSNENRLSAPRRRAKNTVSVRVLLILSSQRGTSQSEAEFTGMIAMIDGGGLSAAVLTIPC